MPTKHGEVEPWNVADSTPVAAARWAVRRCVSADARFQLYFRLLNTPVVSEIYVRGRGRLRERRVQPSTRLIVEGFPGSGNTYCRQSILLSNPDISPNHICSHTHSPRIVKRAVSRGVPCLVLVRNPRDAVSSLIRRFPGVSLSTACHYYTMYHRALLPDRDKILIARFEAVVSDFSAVVVQLNEKFDTQFATEKSVGLTPRRIIDSIDQRNRSRNNGLLDEATISRPSPSLGRTKPVLGGMSDVEARSMRAAMDAYQQCVG